MRDEKAYRQKVETVLMTHLKIHFCGEIRLIFTKIFLLPLLIWNTDHDLQAVLQVGTT